MSAASNKYQNWSSVVVTPSGGGAITVPEVIDLAVDATSPSLRFEGDRDAFASLIRTPQKTRKVKITSSAINVLATILEDTPCTIVGVLNDLGNGTGTGAITCTLTNAVRNAFRFSGKNNTVAAGSLEFEAYATDGQTDPLTISVAS